MIGKESKEIVILIGIFFDPIIYNILSAPPDGFPAVGGSESFMLDFLLQEAYFDTSIQERIYIGQNKALPPDFGQGAFIVDDECGSLLVVNGLHRL